MSRFAHNYPDGPEEALEAYEEAADRRRKELREFGQCIACKRPLYEVPFVGSKVCSNCWHEAAEEEDGA